MKTSHVIIFNLAMLFLGIWGVYWKLDKVDNIKSTSTVTLKVGEFESVLSKSTIPDSLLNRLVFTKLYGYYSESRPTVLVDSFYAKLDQKEITAMKLDKFKQDLMNMKTRCDQIVLKNEKEFEKTIEQGLTFLDVLIAMCLAGLLGGVLANLRGFFEFIREEKKNKFPEHLKIPYIIRPFTGMLSGMLVFFLTSVLISTSTVSVETHFIPFKAMITFMGIAILAGFASQEFTEKLKSAASVLFGSAQPTVVVVSDKPNETKDDNAGTEIDKEKDETNDTDKDVDKKTSENNEINEAFKNLSSGNSSAFIELIKKANQKKTLFDITTINNQGNIFRNRD